MGFGEWRVLEYDREGGISGCGNKGLRGEEIFDDDLSGFEGGGCGGIWSLSFT